MFSEADIHRFTCGDCHILAKRIARMLPDWHLATFADHEDDPILHAFCLSPDRAHALDIEGLRPVDEFQAHWKAYSYTIKTWTPAELSRSCWWCPPQFGHYSYRRAREIAGKLLDSLQLI